MSDNRLSIIVPALNEATCIGGTLASLQSLRIRGHEVIVVDGGSSDGTPDLAEPLADIIIQVERGRARQMNAGASRARYAILLFLHADTVLPAMTDGLVMTALSEGYGWGRFDVRIEPADVILRLVAAGMNLRSRLTGMATGDQALFVERQLFEQVNGYPDIPLMEDLALCDRLLAIGPPVCLRAQVTTSARRWQQHGRIRTILKMWYLRLAWRLGADPAELARRYG